MNIKLVNAAVNARLTHGDGTFRDHQLLLRIMDCEEFDLYIERTTDAYPGECVVVDQFDHFKPATGAYADWMRENMVPFHAW